MKRHGLFFVYIIEDKRNTYYTGYTNDIKKRFDLHSKGRGAKYLRGRQPLKLVYLKKYGYYKHAINNEIKIKSLPRKEKEELVQKFKTKITFNELLKDSLI
ncbi:MAG: GIY-YIG nuclease family protein [Candidatus Omnitrophica bacterium]|nr:GIY-YIG nuclease family protein [Candidatus Omnitrophota bacterium]